MKKQQHILTLIIILAILALVILIGSMIYDEKIKQNKIAVETISIPKIEEKKEETDIKEEKQEQEQVQETEEYIGEEEQATQIEEKNETENKDEKAIELAKKEWGEDESVTFSIDEKKDTKYYVAVKQEAIVVQWYEVDTTNWTIKEY